MLNDISISTMILILGVNSIAAFTGSACNCGSTQVSHVIKAIDVLSLYSEGTIRISFNSDNQIKDVNVIVSGIIKIL